MTEPAVKVDSADSNNVVPDTTPKYEGNRFPWWLLLIWLGFIWWAVTYFIEWGGPEYSEWFAKPAEVTHRPMHK